MKPTERYKPAVAKDLLLFLAGAAWLVVGVLLLLRAFAWFEASPPANSAAGAGIGVVLGILVHRFGFIRIANKNVARILQMEGRRCLFAFIPWRSYVIIAVMIAMGALLRHSSVPRVYLGLLYTGIGMALAVSSLTYLRAYVAERRGTQTMPPTC